MPTPEPSRIYAYDRALYGSAQWASRAHLRERGYGSKGRIFLGYGLPESPKDGAFPVTSDTARHLLTAAPTRSGKSVSTCVPQLLSHPGSAVVIDPKGELAICTARFREQVLGQKVVVMDPWNIACPELGITPARFNIFDWIDPASDDFVEDAYLAAEALVQSPGQSDPHWSGEAKALIAALSMEVAASSGLSIPGILNPRDLSRVRDLLSLAPAEFREMVGGRYEENFDGGWKLVSPGMAQSDNPYIRNAAGRILSKNEREFASILSTAQQNTNFLESPKIRESLSASDFDFRELERGAVTVYLVLPAARLVTYSRWLRLLLTVAITAVSRFSKKPDPPVLFLLDEMGALGKLDVVETAFGLMAGYGMQLHAIVQDFNQLASIYGPRWQTFIANSGIIQVFGTRDVMTAEYVSKLCGTTTVESLSHASAMKRAGLFADPHYLSREDSIQGRSLITPDEIMTMHPATQILALAHANPVVGYRTAYFLDRRFRDRRGRPYFDIHPHYRGQPVPSAHDFTSSRLDVGALLHRHISAG